jgi:UDP-glucuronate decarboxylase
MRVFARTPSNLQLVFNPLPSDDPKQRRPDARLAKSALGWTASTPLDMGLARTIKFFKNLLSRPDAE